VDELLAAVQQLPPTEVREFQRRFVAWSGPNGGLDTDSPGKLDEAALLAQIRENSTLPAAEQQRFERLRRKGRAERLTKSDAKELQELWRGVEQMNVTRLAALAELARRRGMDVPALMRHLGLPENLDAR
jgi:hypothetical protein